VNILQHLISILGTAGAVCIPAWCSQKSDPAVFFSLTYAPAAHLNAGLTNIFRRLSLRQRLLDTCLLYGHNACGLGLAGSEGADFLGFLAHGLAPKKAC